jgi:hypothetical protein
MRGKGLFLLLPPLFLWGCGSDGPSTAGGPPGGFEPVADVQQLMLTIVEPAAEVYWDAVGWIIDGTGTHEIRPETEEDWEEVLNAAYMVAESGNLLMMDGRRPDDRTWVAMSRAMIEAGRQAIAAAEAQDEAAVFEVGGAVYQTCTGCHAIYAAETLRPSFRPDE